MRRLQFARRHRPKGLGRQPQNAETKRQRIVPGEGGAMWLSGGNPRGFQALCGTGGFAGWSLGGATPGGVCAPNVAASKSAAIWT